MRPKALPVHPVALLAPSPALNLARLAVSVLFFVNGAVFAAWAANIPAVQRTMGLEAGSLGLVLTAVPAGAMIGMPLSGLLAPTLGSRCVAAVAALLLCATLPFLAAAPNPVILALALALFGRLAPPWTSP